MPDTERVEQPAVNTTGGDDVALHLKSVLIVDPDMHSRDQLRRGLSRYFGLVEGVDAIIHTAAWVNFRQDRLTQFTGINTIAAVDLFKAARKAGVKRFLQISTVAAIGAHPRGMFVDKTFDGKPFTNWGIS